MSPRFSASFDRSGTAPLPTQGRKDNGRLHRGLLGASSRGNRQAHLLNLLARIQVDGAQNHEQEIDQVRAVCDLGEAEREIVRQIFCLGFDAAEKDDRHDKMWTYRWLLVRLLLHQPLDQPIPGIIPREVTGYDAEPSVTQPSPKQGNAAHQVRTASIPRKVFRYTLCAIGVAAFIYTGIVMHSPTGGRDAAKPATDNQQDMARAPLPRERRFEPLAHAGALSPPTAIEPLAERRSVSLRESVSTHNPLVNEVLTSLKSAATAKPNLPGQTGKIRSPTKVADQAPTVEAAKGKNSEREAARDSFPIFQTRRRILLREEPRFGAAAEIMLDRGARLVVLEIIGKWLKVKMEKTGAPGFVRKEFVVPAAAVGSLNATQAKSNP